jgi:hypothetical protein
MQSPSPAQVAAHVVPPPQKYGVHDGLPVQPAGAFEHVPFVAPLKPSTAPLHTSQAPAAQVVSQQNPSTQPPAEEHSRHDAGTLQSVAGAQALPWALRATQWLVPSQ